MEVLAHKEYIFIPDHSYAIYGVDRLIQDFCKKNHLNYYVYSLQDIKKGIINNDIIDIIKSPIALFISPVSLKINYDLFQLFGNNIRSFATPSTGIDHVDLLFLLENQIPFFDAQGENKDSVVEYVLSALPYVIDENKLLKRDLIFCIIGFGRIGSLLAKVLKDLDFKYIPIDPYVLPDEYDNNLKKINECDVITFHVPLTYDDEYATYQMVTLEFLKSLKNKIIINTSRGQIFTKEACSYLMQNFLSIKDVFLYEPPDNILLDSKLLQVSTPHVAGYNWISRFRGVYKILQKFSNVFQYKFYYDINDFKPQSYQLEIFDSIKKETFELKKNPRYFFIRDRYPVRADIKNQKYKKDWNQFHKLIYSYFYELH